MPQVFVARAHGDCGHFFNYEDEWNDLLNHSPETFHTMQHTMAYLLRNDPRVQVTVSIFQADMQSLSV